MPRSRRKTSNFRNLFWKETNAAWLLILANVAAYFYLVSAPADHIDQWIVSPGALLEGRFWTLITSGFIHRDIWHLVFNMWGLLAFGRVVERHFGPAKTVLVYCGSLILSMGMAAAVYGFVLQTNTGIIGASGAVMGMLAVAMLLDPFVITWEMMIPFPLMIKGWMFISADLGGFLGGERDGVSHLTHLCGFLSVGIIVYFLSRNDQRRLKTGLLIHIISFIGFLILRSMVLNGQLSMF